ncbi:hypothetical protein HIM_06105 [Hirsutella minnesotensis 3608]|uniref:Matrin-type domain-containing protein n=1 Tax=Hirsutella minnesotensis 3608 TaxID=1043627 RepID=A0A0F8A509_9HYPO|nr:hypothetical protein HIM_06105 [Hirsutella minnesotensis 3608]
MLEHLEDIRSIEEDLERIQVAIANLYAEDAKHVSTRLLKHKILSKEHKHLTKVLETLKIRDRLKRDHMIAHLQEQHQQQNANLIQILERGEERRKKLAELEGCDPFAEFYKGLDKINEYHARYPNQQAENPENRYKPKDSDDPAGSMNTIVDAMFSGEEAYGRFFDLHQQHDAFLNLPGVKRLNYIQYLENFDSFVPGQGGLKRSDKINDQYFKYLADVEEYFVSFRQRTRPLEDNDKILSDFTDEFEKAWEKDEVEGWKPEGPAPGDATSPAVQETVWCEDCEKEFTNKNVYKGHLSGRKHKKAAEKRKQRQQEEGDGDKLTLDKPRISAKRVQEKAVARREYRIKKLVASLSVERSDTRVNVERRQGMTEREREQELENLHDMMEPPKAGAKEADKDGEDGEEKIYNPLKLPLAWDGKPIPYWLYRLHGLGVEFHCEICGNFVYMGRRAFDKHFGEPRHIYGLKCLGITSVALFRDITKIEEALKLWNKMQQDQKKSKIDEGSIVQMEDGEGNVMPEKVYHDLQKQGLL